MASEVKYGTTDDDVLRSVLHDVWKSRCYFCSSVKEFNEVQTDHIIPKSLSGGALQDTLKRLGKPPNFDLDDPENLAPICAVCNGPLRKGRRDLTGVPLIVAHLDRAAELRDEVIRRVNGFSSRGKLSRAFVLLKAADLSDARVRQVFEDGMPAVMRKLSSAGSALSDLPFYRSIDVDLGDGQMVEVSVELGDKPKRALAVMEELTGTDLDDLVVAPISDLWVKVLERSGVALEGLDDDGLGPVNAGPPVPDLFTINIDSVSMEKVAGTFVFTFSGGFDAFMSASVVRDDAWDGLAEFQGDVSAAGSFSFFATWDPGDPSMFESDEVWFDSWNADAWLAP